MTYRKLDFIAKGYPEIRVFEWHFEVKPRDWSGSRKFKFSEVSQIIHYNPKDEKLAKLFYLFSPFYDLISKNDPWKLKVELKNGGDWTYETKNVRNQELNQILDVINHRIRELT